MSLKNTVATNGHFYICIYIITFKLTIKLKNRLRILEFWKPNLFSGLKDTRHRPFSMNETNVLHWSIIKVGRITTIYREKRIYIQEVSPVWWKTLQKWRWWTLMDYSDLHVTTQNVSFTSNDMCNLIFWNFVLIVLIVLLKYLWSIIKLKRQQLQ